MNRPRCDQTEAWAALKGHFEAHGRDFDVREAFAGDVDDALPSHQSSR